MNNLVNKSGDLVKDLVNDTISRQAAISAVNTALFPKINTAKDAEKALMALPSAQPECEDENALKTAFLRMASYVDSLLVCSDEQKETLINLIAKVADYMPWSPHDEGLPEPCEDAVSRWGVINAIENGKPYQQDADDIAEMVQNMPSVTPKKPEITEADIKEYCHKRCLTVVDNNLFNEMVITWAKQDKQRWIPCSERLPVFDTEVLVYTSGDFCRIMSLEEYDNDDGVLWRTAEEYSPYSKCEVFAWMPLPEYKGEQE